MQHALTSVHLVNAPELKGEHCSGEAQLIERHARKSAPRVIRFMVDPSEGRHFLLSGCCVSLNTCLVGIGPCGTAKDKKNNPSCSFSDVAPVSCSSRARPIALPRTSTAPATSIALSNAWCSSVRCPAPSCLNCGSASCAWRRREVGFAAPGHSPVPCEEWFVGRDSRRASTPRESATRATRRRLALTRASATLRTPFRRADESTRTPTRQGARAAPLRLRDRISRTP